MNKTWGTFLLLLLLGNSLFAATPKIYAIVVGISDYKDENIPNLKYAEKDAKAFYDFLHTPYAGAVPEENIAFLTGINATKTNILKYAVDKLRQAGEDDMVVFYFSGHGSGDASDGSGYFLCYDSENDFKEATGLSMDDIAGRMDKCKAKLKVSYIDACHAGMFKTSGTKGDLAENNAIITSAYNKAITDAGEGNVAFVASSARQQSLEDDKLGFSIFTYYLLRGLKGEADKANKALDGYNNGITSVRELGDYLKDKVQTVTKGNQSPSVNGVYDVDFPLSILTTNAAISTEIAKRPVPKKGVPPALKPQITITQPLITDMAKGQCNERNWLYYGSLNLMNNFKEKILVYHTMSNTVGNIDQNYILSEGELTPLGRFMTAQTDHEPISSVDFKFYFRTIDESKPTKYGVLLINIETCKIKTVAISDKNLYLSVNGEKR